jgi:hypothetical protein
MRHWIVFWQHQSNRRPISFEQAVVDFRAEHLGGEHTSKLVSGSQFYATWTCSCVKLTYPKFQVIKQSPCKW